MDVRKPELGWPFDQSGSFKGLVFKKSERAIGSAGFDWLPPESSLSRPIVREGNKM